MISRRYLFTRLGWTIFVAWLLLTVTFLLFDIIPDPNKPFVPPQPGYNTREIAERLTELYFTQMRYDQPLLDRYLHWMRAYVTLDWGRSFVEKRAVTAIVGDAAPITLGYLLPSMILASIFGALQGLYGALDRLDPLTRIGNVVVYSGLGLPAFWVGFMLFFLAQQRYGNLVVFDPALSVLSPHNLIALSLPTAVMTLTLGAVFARYTRAETAGYLSQEFIKTVRANGGRSRDVARHTLRNAMPPLFSLFVTRIMTVLVLSIFAIEVVFGLPGLGQVTLRAIENRDIALILAMTFITILVGLLGNLLQDIAYAVFDPRIDSEKESGP